MIYKLIYIVVAFTSIVNCHNLLPASITPCALTLPQSDFDECILKEAKNFLPIFAKGLPAMHVLPIDPLFVDHVTMSSSNLAFDIYNSTLVGLRTAKIQRFHLELENGKTQIILNADIKVHGKYVLHGQLITAFPLSGNGDIDIDIKNIRFVIEVDFIRLKHKNGKEYSKLTNYTSKYEVLDKAVFAMDNLFEGKNALLEKTAIAVINEDWKDMINNVAKPAIHEIIEKIIDIIGNFFNAVSTSELYSVKAENV